MWRISLCGAMILGLVSVEVHAEILRSPVPVSPGSTVGYSSVADGCPTFSWGGIPGAQSYELVVYSVDDNNPVNEAPSSRPALIQSLPGVVDSWTPALEQCLSAGQAYAWSIRAVDGQGEGSWSEAILFRIVAGPSVSEVESAMAVLRRYLARERGSHDQRDTEFSTEERLASGSQPDKSSHSRDSAPPGRDQLRQITSQHPHRARLEPLSSETLGFEGLPAEATVAPPSSYALVANGDTALEGVVFQEGFPFLHAYGGQQSANLALGLGALANVTPDKPTSGDGEANTALGRAALSSNTSGDGNTGVGALALFLNTTGKENTAVGAVALANNTTGSRNTAMGDQALIANRTGFGNTAIGSYALNVAQAGNRNIAIGAYAGLDALGSYNIFIGNYGTSSDKNRIRIGQNSVHQTTTIAGDIGLGTDTPVARLHVRDSLSGAETPSNHVALIENFKDNVNGDVLGLKIGNFESEATNSFVTFFLNDNFVAGRIEGDHPVGVVYTSFGADYAEWLRKIDPNAQLQPGEVVGLFGDSVSRTTTGADGVMVVSTGPVVAGNDPGLENRDAYVRVAFVGQVKTRVHGEVRSGDYLVPSGINDGRAVAVRSAELDHDALKWVIGRALADRQLGDVDSVLTLVGVADPGPLAAVLTRQNRTMEAQYRELKKQADELARQQLELARHKADLDDLQRSIFTIPIMEASQR